MDFAANTMLHYQDDKSGVVVLRYGTDPSDNTTAAFLLVVEHVGGCKVRGEEFT